MSKYYENRKKKCNWTLASINKFFLRNYYVQKFSRLGEEIRAYRNQFN